MADSDSLRSKRKRMHARGDHGLCHHGGVSAVVALPPPRGTGRDPVACLWQLAERLEQAHASDPASAPVARVLLATLAELRAAPGAAAPPPAAAGDDDPLAAARDLAQSVP